ncbi:hypothetical protein Tco_1242901, partial [Tanacetum coccineum]
MNRLRRSWCKRQDDIRTGHDVRCPKEADLEHGLEHAVSSSSRAML